MPTVHTTMMSIRAADARVPLMRTRQYLRSSAPPRTPRSPSQRALPLHLPVHTQRAVTTGMLQPRACFKQAQPAQHSGRTKDVLPIWFNPGLFNWLIYGFYQCVAPLGPEPTTCAHCTAILNLEAWFQYPTVLI